MIRQATLPLLFALSPTLQSDPVEAMERRVRRAALRREPVVLGTAHAPSDPPARGKSPLRALLPLPAGLGVAIPPATPRIRGGLGLRAELDGRTPVPVRLPAPLPPALAPAPR